MQKLHSRRYTLYGTNYKPCVTNSNFNVIYPNQIPVQILLIKLFSFLKCPDSVIMHYPQYAFIHRVIGLRFRRSFEKTMHNPVLIVGLQNIPPK